MRKQAEFILVALSLLATHAAAADKQRPLPADLPAYGPTQGYTPPPVTELKLENGLTVWLAPVSGFPKVTFTLTVKGGFAADPASRSGIAQLIAAVVTEGTKTATARQVAEAMQACGGDLNASADADRISIQTSALSEKADAALKVLSDVVENAAFADNEVEVAKQNSASQLEANEAEPRFLARRALYRAIFGNHPYAIVWPSKQVIEQTTAPELRTEFARRFRPDRALLVVAGNFDSKQLTAAITADFAKWRSVSADGFEPVPAPPASISRTVVYVPRQDSVQTTLYLGSLAPGRAQPDYEAAQLANAIYGGMFGSRLVLNIREDKGYTYSPGSFLSTFSATGLLVSRADVRNAVTGASFNEISYELNRIATTAPEDSEVTHAKRYLIGSMAINLQSQAQLANELAEYWGDGLKPGDLAQEGEKLGRVSVPEVQAAGRKYFPMSRMTTVAVGDEKVIKDELAPFGLQLNKAQ